MTDHIAELILADTWRLRLGDPTAAGYLTTAAFLAASLLSFRTAAAAPALPRDRQKRLRLFFLTLGAALLLLGLNKQLDLHILITQLGREIANRHGWFSARRTVQLYFAAGIAAAAIALASLVIAAMRPLWRRTWPAILGMTLIIASGTIRLASIYHVSEKLGLRPAPPWLHLLLDLAGSASVALAALRKKDPA